MTFVIILSAAFCIGLGFVLQQRAAQDAPPEDLLSVRLLVDLIRKPRWLLGIAVMVVGQLLGAVALGRADVTLVEPLLTCNLLFALGLARLISAQTLGRREWCGTLVLLVGVTVFVVAGRPRSAEAPVDDLRRLAVVLGVCAVAAVFVVASKRRSGSGKAVLLAAAAGTLYGLQDGFTRRAMLALDGGVARLVVSWSTYLVIVVALVGLLLAQSAFGAAPLRASLPAMTVAEPLSGIVLGVGVFGEVVRLAPLWLGLESAGLLAMLIGIVLLARSPHLHAHLTRRRRIRNAAC